MELAIDVSRSETKRTALHDEHVQLGARMVDFADWRMPVQYDGVLREHERVRSAAGLFDVSHMGELFFGGPGALPTLDHLATNDVTSLQPGRALYTPLCNERGGVRDDVLLYRFDATQFMMVVNAANHAKIAAWSREHLQPETELHDRSEALSLLALQGPRSREILSSSRILGAIAARLHDLPYYHFLPGDGRDLVAVSRTGYTGELGFEIYASHELAIALWQETLASGRAHGAGPVGLAARDTLRFEVGFCLYGNELAEDVSPLEAGLGWTVKLRKADFVGRAALERQKREGVPRKLVGLELQERAIARAGFEVRVGERTVGSVTSGTYAPTLQRSLAMALVQRDALEEPMCVAVRGRGIPAQRVTLPFHRPAATK
ncbi:MAG: glycine cleavage system aminomethyltransferase GcvT [Candidatus Latescibacterota bacterium]|nr:MAG: glycine cleavage system aminomethyltransferase GcvT [Candidatus Latescibacterota bacterium]